MTETYVEKLKDPRWQKKRLSVMQRDNWTCQYCGDKQACLNIHHKRYIASMDPWEYEDFDLITLCELCHGEYSKYEREHGKPKFFETMKLPYGESSVLFYLTEKGLFMSVEFRYIPEFLLKPLYHFIINTWLKHG